MGLFWDLYQQSQISAHADQSAALASRVAALEAELRRTQEVVHELIHRLETQLGADLDGDNRVG